jgi:predicted outer membrane repeat protein
MDEAMTLRNWNTCIFAVVLFGSFLPATNAAATVVFTVDSIADLVDDDPANSVCHTAEDTCTLRAAVMSANQVSGEDATITLPAGVYTLSIAAGAGDGDDTGDLNLTAPASGNPGIAIVGAGAGVTIIDANHIDRLFKIDSGRTASISGVTLRNGLFSLPGGNGGAIYNAGTLTLSGCALLNNTVHNGSGGAVYGAASATTSIDHCTLSGNAADYSGGAIANLHNLDISHSTLTGNNGGYVGGGIFNDGNHVALDDSTVSGNTALENGGGISTDNGTVTLSRSTISGNETHGNGGGIAVVQGNLIMTNGTIALNNADVNGGGIYNQGDVGTVDIYSSTIAYNDAGHDFNVGFGGGIYVYVSPNTFSLSNTILARNTINNQLNADDCTTSLSYVVLLGRNLAINMDNCLVYSGDAWTLDPALSLGPLQYNGGPTATIAPLAGSNAIDGTSITGSVCNDAQSNTLTTDQRGYPRTGACDVGAVEYDGIFIDGYEVGG